MRRCFAVWTYVWFCIVEPDLNCFRVAWLWGLSCHYSHMVVVTNFEWNCLRPLLSFLLDMSADGWLNPCLYLVIAGFLMLSGDSVINVKSRFGWSCSGISRHTGLLTWQSALSQERFGFPCERHGFFVWLPAKVFTNVVPCLNFALNVLKMMVESNNWVKCHPKNLLMLGESSRCCSLSQQFYPLP